MLLLSAAALAAPMSDDQFIDFLYTYPALSPAQVVADLEIMTPRQQALLLEREGLGASVYTRACQGTTEGLVFRASEGPMSCGDLLALAEENIEWGLSLGARRYAESQRLGLIQALSCEQGWAGVACDPSSALAQE